MVSCLGIVWRYMYQLTKIQWCQHTACHQPHDLHPICKSMDSPLREPPQTANTTHLWVKLILVTVVTLGSLQLQMRPFVLSNFTHLSTISWLLF